MHHYHHCLLHWLFAYQRIPNSQGRGHHDGSDEAGNEAGEAGDDSDDGDGDDEDENEVEDEVEVEDEKDNYDEAPPPKFMMYDGSSRIFNAIHHMVLQNLDPIPMGDDNTTRRVMEIIKRTYQDDDDADTFVQPNRWPAIKPGQLL